MRQLSILKRNFTELTGVVHNHSSSSYDCDVSIDNILKAGQKNALDYITINDHNALAPASEIKESLNRYKTKHNYEPLLIAGTELNDQDNNHHLLAFAGELSGQNETIEEIITRQKKAKAVLFAAHPYEKRATKSFPLYIWTKTELLESLAGMEIWNYSSSWLSKLNPKLNGLLLVLFPNLFIRKPFPENVKLWDDLNKNGAKVAAVGSTDAHGIKHKILFFNIRILSHLQLFKTIRTNVLIKEGVAITEQTVLQALAAGNSYIVNYRHGYPYNFYAGINRENEAGVTFGEIIKFEKGLKFYYRLPKDAKVLLIKDGEQISQQDNSCGHFPVKAAGNYRLEISRFGFGWIYTNNIYVYP